ncbi:hypothetical protein COOONC_21343 [Cooperia oncophora]
MNEINRVLYLESVIERILRDLEEKERIFETYKVASGSNIRFRTRSIIDFIDFELNRVIRVPLYQIYNVDPSFCEMLCNAFFGRTKCWKREGEMSSQGYDVDLWPSCRFHLYAGAICMYACVVMERLFKGVHDEYQAAVFAENRWYSINLIAHFTFAYKLHGAFAVTRHLSNLWLWLTEQSDGLRLFIYNVVFPQIHGSFQNFLAHNCCQSLIERRWHGRLRLSPGFFEWTAEHLFGFYRDIVIVMNCITLAAVVIHAGFTDGEVTSGTLGKFLFIFVIFWVIFAVCHISMAEEYAVRSNHSLAWMMFQNGAFEIFGEVDDEDKIGTVTGCADISWRSMWTASTSDMRCLFRTALIPITVFTYMLVASIMLVNLLTALLSKEYEEVSGGGSAVYWKYENYFLLTTKRIETTSQNEDASPEERIRHAQALFQKIFQILMECIDEETGQIRTRANTAMEELQQLNQSIYNSLPNFRGVDSVELPHRPHFYYGDLIQHSSPELINPLDPNRTGRIYSI